MRWWLWVMHDTEASPTVLLCEIFSLPDVPTLGYASRSPKRERALLLSPSLLVLPTGSRVATTNPSSAETCPLTVEQTSVRNCDKNEISVKMFKQQHFLTHFDRHRICKCSCCTSEVRLLNVSSAGACNSMLCNIMPPRKAPRLALGIGRCVAHMSQ